MSDRKINFPSNFYTSSTLNSISNQTNYSECARIINRPLNNGKAGLLFSLSKGLKPFGNLNLDASHEHILWEQSRDNLGFRGADNELGIWPFKAKGELFSEEVSRKNYQSVDNTCYDGNTMRQSVLEVGEPTGYRMFGFNCQEYMDKVRQKYKSLIGSIL